MGCVYQRKKCVLMFFYVRTLDGRDLDKMIAQTNAYLAARWLSGDLKWTLLETSVRVSLRLRASSFLSEWEVIERVLIADGRTGEINN